LEKTNRYNRWKFFPNVRVFEPSDHQMQVKQHLHSPEQPTECGSNKWQPRRQRQGGGRATARGPAVAATGAGELQREGHGRWLTADGAPAVWRGWQQQVAVAAAAFFTNDVGDPSTTRCCDGGRAVARGQQQRQRPWRSDQTATSEKRRMEARLVCLRRRLTVDGAPAAWACGGSRVPNTSVK